MLGDKECLLRNPVGSRSTFLPVEGSLCDAEGCYLYYDSVNGYFVRSGKVAGRGIMLRHLEHDKQAKRNGDGSKMYIEYPGKDSNRVKMAKENNIRPRPWRAYFEDLALFCGMAFTRSDVVDQRLAVDCDAEGSTDGIFLWDTQTIDSLNKCEKDGETTLVEKQAHMVAYLLELGYDLMLNRDYNISTMPGFEKFGLAKLSRR